MLLGGFSVPSISLLAAQLSCFLLQRGGRKDLEGHKLVKGKDENIRGLLNTLLCSDDKCPDTQSHPPSSIRAGWHSRKNKLCFWRFFPPAKDRSLFREFFLSCFPLKGCFMVPKGFLSRRKASSSSSFSFPPPCAPLPYTHNNLGFSEGHY